MPASASLTTRATRVRWASAPSLQSRTGAKRVSPLADLITVSGFGKSRISLARHFGYKNWEIYCARNE